MICKGTGNRKNKSILLNLNMVWSLKHWLSASELLYSNAPYYIRSESRYLYIYRYMFWTYIRFCSVASSLWHMTRSLFLSTTIPICCVSVCVFFLSTSFYSIFASLVHWQHLSLATRFAWIFRRLHESDRENFETEQWRIGKADSDVERRWNEIRDIIW